MASIYPKGEFPCCYGCSSVALSSDSNEDCHQEGISLLHKSGEHSRCERGNHMRFNHEAKYNVVLS